MASKVTIPQLQQMKRDGKKIVGMVVWDYQMARIADAAGIEIMSVGDSVGVNLWGQPHPLEVTMEQMITVTQAVRRGTERALLSCDFPYGPLQEGVDEAVRAAIRFVKEAGVDMIKLDGAADYPEAVTALTRAGIPVWAQFGITPQTALQYGIEYAAMSGADAQVAADMQDRLLEEAKMLEAAGAAMLDFTNSGPIVGPVVAKAIDIPVIGGFGGGPWLDGRVRMAHAAIGYGAKFLEGNIETYANVAQTAFDAITAFSEDVRAARQIKGAPKTKKH
ncbi:MAG: 3-methyl-2-oxobutanoate hydroxymethyltransferase [Gammaproteobacteria bacterium]|nr:3-methyl-2-oxobutanoate hydroxymethyltransferase [Gammaproteobacteria bacterium]